jgi:hypothetical protein
LALRTGVVEEVEGELVVELDEVALELALALA